MSAITGLPASASFAATSVSFDPTGETLGTVYNLGVYISDGFNETGPFNMTAIVSDKDPPRLDTLSQILSSVAARAGISLRASLPPRVNFSPGDTMTVYY